MPVLETSPHATIHERTPHAAAPAISTRLDQDTEAFIDAFRGLAALGVLVTHSCDLGIRTALGGIINQEKVK